MTTVEKSPIELPGIASLLDRYGVFFLDQFGVLHDGSTPYPGAVEALERLKSAGKRIVLLSNSGRRSAANEARLIKLGFKSGTWDLFLSSGEFAWRIFSGHGGGSRLKPGAKCLLIARENDRSAIDGLDLELVDSGAEAELILLSGSEGDRYELGHYEKLLAPAARRAVPCYCTNPDKIMLTSVGPRFGAGRIAEIYEAFGGPVTWIGKPFTEIYRVALSMIGSPDGRGVVCVGDSVEHDVAGGKAAGLATALVAGGILAGASADELAKLFRENDAEPDYLLPGFRW
jgi:HAD superfamily hydrolase (TIGR01459 family)